MSEYKNLCFEVRNERGILQAMFCRRWEAEKYIEVHENWTITKAIMKSENTVTITKDYFRDVVTNASLEFIEDEEISNTMRTVLPLTTIVAGRIIEEHLFER